MLCTCFHRGGEVGELPPGNEVRRRRGELEDLAQEHPGPLPAGEVMAAARGGAVGKDEVLGEDAAQGLKPDRAYPTRFLLG